VTVGKLREIRDERLALVPIRDLGMVAEFVRPATVPYLVGIDEL
jgi:hypothetical protein